MGYLDEVEPGDESREDRFPTALPFPGGPVALGVAWPSSHENDETPTTLTYAEFSAENLLGEARDALICLLSQAGITCAMRVRVSTALLEIELAAQERR